jgi:hypothetical protein
MPAAQRQIERGIRPRPLFPLTLFVRKVFFFFRSALAVGAFIGFPPFFSPIAGDGPEKSDPN